MALFSNNKWVVNILILLTIILVIFLFTSNTPKDPIKIGFIGGLTGRVSEVGVSGRNAVEMAVEEVNAHGGINDRPVKLIVKNSHHDPYSAVKGFKELAQKGVVAIIGPYDSDMMLMHLSNNQVLIVSPTVETNKLTGMEDNFIRVSAPSRKQSVMLAENAYYREDVKSIALVYDLSNQTYSKELCANFKKKYEELGGEVLTSISYKTRPNRNFMDIAKKVKDSGVDGVLISANALDAAMLSQQIKKLDGRVKIFISDWAMMDELIRHGGSAVEGALVAGLHKKNCYKDEFVEFKKRYYSKYREEPNYASIYSYEAAQVLFKAIRKGNSFEPSVIKENILRQKEHEGLQESFNIDQYGDAERSLYLFKIEKGRFKLINE